MTKIILISFSVIFLFSCGREKLACETQILKDAIWISFYKDTSFIYKVPIDSVKFKFVEPSLGKDSIQNLIYREKDNIQNKKYFFAFTNIIISKNTKIYISFLNQQYTISDIVLGEHERKYFLWSSEMECIILGYKINGIKSNDFPFTINVNM